MKKIVNLLTMARIFATFILPFIWKYCDALFILIFVGIILLTDFFDGFLARKFKVQSLFGSLLDVFADKVFGLVVVIIIALNIKMYFLTLIMELLITFINIYGGTRGATTISSFLGKTKMWFLGISTMIGLVIIFNNQLVNIINIDWFINIMNLIYTNRVVVSTFAVSITAGTEIIVATDYLRHINKQIKKKKVKLVYNFKDKKDLMYVLFDTDYYLNNKKEPLSKHLLK